MTAPRLAHRLRLAATMACLVLLHACGDGREGEGTQPAPDVTTFEQGRFDDLPLLPDSEPFGPRSEQDGIVARSYRATGATPVAVLDFYEAELAAAGWQPAEPAFREDTAGRADWVTDGWRLELSVRSIEDRRNPPASEPTVQYSLVLRPR